MTGYSWPSIEAVIREHSPLQCASEKRYYALQHGIRDCWLKWADYMVSTCTSPWYVWPILVNGRSYFDLAETSYPIHFEMDATCQLIRSAA